jgi:DNA-binding CsgD family transcriptional regulator/tetratricopeptide (TPR) repeat protein
VLVDRHAARDVLDRLVDDVRAGDSHALVLWGDAGVGKTVLLDYLVHRARGCRVARLMGVQSEVELAFAGLHQLCSPFADHFDRLPEPQLIALRTAFGVTTGPPPDRFLLGLAVLNLLSEVARERPLICVIDDDQWLDQASAQVLGFVARRLAADPIGIVVATRVRRAELVGLPDLLVEGLPEDDARALFDSALAVPLDARVRDLVIAEAQGNPLALLELLRGLSPTELAGGFGLPRAAPLAGKIENSFRQQLAALPVPTQRLLQLAAADPTGDLVLVRRAAGRLGLPVQAAIPAVEAGLVEFRVGVRFRHPLVRSAAYRSAPADIRQELHGALAEVTDAVVDPDRRAWHRAQAAAGPDEEVAAELERSAGRAQARGGLAAAAAFLERSVLLTADPARHADRTLAAAEANLRAGVFDRALELLASAEAGRLDDFAGARADLLRARVAFASGLGSDAPPLLLKAAGRLEHLDLDLARETYLNGWLAASFAGNLTGAGGFLEVSRAARALPAAPSPRPIDLLLEGLALTCTDGRAAGAATLRRVVQVFSSGHVRREDGLSGGWMAAILLWDDHAAREIMERQVGLSRAAGALDELPLSLTSLATSAVSGGDFTAATVLIDEIDAICRLTGSRIAPYPAMYLAALRGDPAALTPLTEAAGEAARSGGQGAVVPYIHWATAILHNGLGQYADALAAAREATGATHPFVSMWALPEMVEAAARAGDVRAAAEALATLTESTRAGGTEAGLGLEARSRALVDGPEHAEASFREAIDRLGHTRLRPDLARAHLLHGEWLRRENRRVDAREQLRVAHRMLAEIGMEAFAERARRELLATGEKVRKRAKKSPGTLTAQEIVIARLAVDGRTNAEIGAQLFLSARTIEWHMRHIFTKLGVGSRRELPGTLFDAG